MTKTTKAVCITSKAREYGIAKMLLARHARPAGWVSTAIGPFFFPSFLICSVFDTAEDMEVGKQEERPVENKKTSTLKDE